MALELNSGVRILNPAPVASRLYSLVGAPYLDTAQVLTENTVTRYQGEMYLVDNVGSIDIYWFKNGIANGDLELFSNDVFPDALLRDGSIPMTGPLYSTYVGIQAAFSGVQIDTLVDFYQGLGGSRQIIDTGSIAGNTVMTIGEAAFTDIILAGALATVAGDLSVQQSLTVSGNVTAALAPTADGHLTNKEYVDKVTNKSSLVFDSATDVAFLEETRFRLDDSSPALATRVVLSHTGLAGDFFDGLFANTSTAKITLQSTTDRQSWISLSVDLLLGEITNPDIASQMRITGASFGAVALIDGGVYEMRFTHRI